MRPLPIPIDRLAAGNETNLADEIKEAARIGSVRIIGPGSAGISCTAASLTASDARSLTLPGGLAFISQNRSIFHAILDLTAKDRIGFSYFISTGGMLDVDFADLINFLGNDPRVSSIALYLERLTNFRKFMSAARAISRIKPIIALRSGRACDGKGQGPCPPPFLINDDGVYGAAFKRAGIERVNTFAELFDCAELLAKQPHPVAASLVIITNGRGPGMMAADALANLGEEMAPLNPETIRRLDEILPLSWNRGNPIDLGGGASPERYSRAIEICLAAPEIEALLIILAPHATTDATAVAESLSRVLTAKRIPVCAVWLGAGEVQRGRELLNRQGIPTFETPERAIRAFLHMGSYAHNLKMLQEIPEKLPRDLEFDTNDAREILHRATDAGKDILSAEESEALLVAYGIPVSTGETEDRGYELRLGIKKDQGFGPVIFFGAGGVAGEIAGDFAFSLPL